jgi:hypothetical protein
MPKTAGESMKEIVLPIKCSTVKRWYDLIFYTMAFMTSLTSCVIVWTWRDAVMHGYSPDNPIWKLTLLPCAEWCVIVTFFGSILILITFVVDHLPNLTCIKDEEQP